MADSARENAVDTTRFDEITARLAKFPSRRGVLRLLGAATFGAAGLALLDDAEGKRRKKKKKKKTSPCRDGRKSGNESDVDCGGSCPRCANDKTCNSRDDCDSALCVSSKCQACENANECGEDADGQCACRETAAGPKVCTKINGRFIAGGTCADCRPGEQCSIPVPGDIECILPCGA
jgi:hypothetical protein